MTLCAKNLAKSYKGRAVVKDVGLTVEKSQIVGLLGPNGAGKTTSFYMIVGLVPMDKGQISLNDEDISFLSMHQRARRGIGYVSEVHPFVPYFSVAMDLFFSGVCRKNYPPRHIHDPDGERFPAFIFNKKLIRRRVGIN